MGIKQKMKYKMTKEEEEAPWKSKKNYMIYERYNLCAPVIHEFLSYFTSL